MGVEKARKRKGGEEVKGEYCGRNPAGYSLETWDCTANNTRFLCLISSDHLAHLVVEKRRRGPQRRKRGGGDQKCSEYIHKNALVPLVPVLRCVAARATQAIPEYTSKHKHKDRRKEEAAASA